MDSITYASSELCASSGLSGKAGFYFKTFFLAPFIGLTEQAHCKINKRKFKVCQFLAQGHN